MYHNIGFGMFQGCKNICFSNIGLRSKVQSRYVSVLSKAEARKKRNVLFDEEKKRQRNAVGRLEKIQVKYKTMQEEITFSMNKHLSTPYDCARHMSEGVMKTSAIALVDGNIWDMHRPFTDNCELQFVTLQSPKTGAVNQAFWRTCSLMLGAVIDSAFKDNIEIHLHSFPNPMITSGSFTYDVFLNLPEWQPTDAELRAMSASFVKLAEQNLSVERLDTTESVALEMFQDNPFKSEQIPNIARNNCSTVTLYRIGEHIDISKGPMVGNTYLIGRTTIAAIHKLQSENVENLYRFQGIALPKGIMLNHFAYGILEQRAKKLNNHAWMPQRLIDDVEENIIASAKN